MEHKKLQDYVDLRITGEWGIEAQNNEDDVYVIRTADFVNDGTIDYTKVVKRNIAKNKIDKKKLRYGDIIVEKSGGTNINPVGRVVFFDNNKCNYLSNNFTETLRIKDEYVPKYIFYCLKFKYSSGSTIKMFNKTTGIQNLKMDLFLDQNIPFVNKEEQQRVVNILDRIFKMISNRKHEIEKMNVLIKSQFVKECGVLR